MRGVNIKKDLDWGLKKEEEVISQKGVNTDRTRPKGIFGC